MRRMLRVVAVTATCVYGAKSTWMQSEENAVPRPEAEADNIDISASIPKQAPLAQ